MQLFLDLFFDSSFLGSFFGSLFGAVVNHFFYFGSLSDTVAQIVKLSASDFSAAGNNNVSDVGRVDRKYLFYAYAMLYGEL